jgi:hypothetical protein
VTETEVFKIANYTDLQADGEKYMNGYLLQGIATDTDAAFGDGLSCKRAISHRGKR